jgi:ribonuclease HI
VYREDLMGSQLNELSKGERTSGNPNRYNLRSKKKEGKPYIPYHPTRTKHHVKEVASRRKEKEAQSPQEVVKSPIPEVKDILNPPSSFIFENEIQKIKIIVPFLELVKNEDFKRYLSKMLQPEPSSHPTDLVNLQNEKPVVILGPLVEDRDESSPSFYTSLNINDKVLHNCFMDSGESHNLIPNIVMEELGLEVRKTYHDLYSFDSRKVKCLGVIKDLDVSLFQLPMKSVVMDIVVVEVPPKFGILLSRSWRKILGGTLQMSLSYSTIPVFGGEHIRLYREAQLSYISSDEENPTNHPIFGVDTDLGTSMLHLTDTPQVPIEIRRHLITSCEDPPPNTSIWKMFFDGASSRESVGDGVVFISPTQDTISLSYKIEFETTNNVEEYEALVLGLRAAKDMNIEELTIFGDVELTVHQARNIYQAKHPRLRAYITEVWDLVEIFFLDFNISLIPREENTVENSLVVSTSKFRVPLPLKLKYDVEVKYRPSIPNNVKHWKVFEDDLEIKIFLETVDEFFDLHIDQDQDTEENPYADIFLNKIVGHHIVQLPSNHIPKGLVPLERLFDRNDVVVKVKNSTEDVDVTECNLGTEEDPKYVKLSSSLSKEQRDEYVNILKDFVDVFSWKYEDLRTYDTNIIEHKIPLKEEAKPFRWKLRQINPMLLPIMEKEVKTLLDAQIIIPLRYSEWVANLVPVRNKNGEIILCVDFRNLNTSSKKITTPCQRWSTFFKE